MISEADLELVDLVDLERRIIQDGGFIEFVRRAWPYVEPKPFIEGRHHAVVAQELQDCQAPGVSIQIPPGCSKSLIASVLWPAYLWTLDPTLKILSAGHEPNLTTDQARKSRDLMCGEWYRERWGHKFSLERSAAADDYWNSAGGRRLAIGVETRPTGKHFDIALLDDLIPAGSPSAAEIKRADQWCREVLPGRLLKGARVVVISQRVAEGDTADWARERGHRMVCLPMYYEENHPYPCDVDWRTTEGEILWPEMWDDEDVRAKTKDLTSAEFACQYQQRPSPKGGLIFQTEWLKTRLVLPGKWDKVVISVDASFTAKATSDFAVVQVWGKRGAEFHLLDQWRKRATMPETYEAIMAFRETWAGAPILVEAAANGHAIMQTLERAGVHGVIPVKPIGDKVSRANAIVPLFEAGNVYLPSRTEAPWVDAYRHELETFPGGRNDDQVDATTQALSYLAGKGNNLAEAMRRLAQDGGRGFGTLFG